MGDEEYEHKCACAWMLRQLTTTYDFHNSYDVFTTPYDSGYDLLRTSLRQRLRPYDSNSRLSVVLLTTVLTTLLTTNLRLIYRQNATFDKSCGSCGSKKAMYFARCPHLIFQDVIGITLYNTNKYLDRLLHLVPHSDIITAPPSR